MTISTILQKQLVDTVGSVVITDIVQDLNTSQFMREIRVYSLPDNNGAVTLIYTLALSAAAKESVELTAPSALF